MARRKKRIDRHPNADAAKSVAQAKDKEILSILDRSNQLARTLRDRLHYDKEMERVSVEMTATLERLKASLKVVDDSRISVLGENLGLNCDLQILENEIERRAGRPTLAEKAVADLAYLKEQGLDPAPLVTFLDLMPTTPSPLPTEAALAQYGDALAEWKRVADTLFALAADIVEVVQFREAISAVPVGTAAEATERFAKNKDLILAGLEKGRRIEAEARTERAKLLRRREALVSELHQPNAD